MSISGFSGLSFLFALSAIPAQEPALEESCRAQMKASNGVLKQLEAGMERCGNGFGFMEAAAEIALANKDTHSAVRYLRQAMLSAKAPQKAAHRLLELLPNLPPELADEVRRLGTNPSKQVFFQDNRVRNAWFLQGTCKGVPPTSFTEDHHEHTGVLECPEGVRRKMHFRVEEDLNSPKELVPANTPASIAEVLPPLRKRFGITSKEELKEALEEASEEPSRSNAWLLDFVTDPPGQVMALRSMVAEDPDDLVALHDLSRELIRLGDFQGSFKSLQKVNLATVKVRDTRGARYQPADLLAARCLALRNLGKLIPAEKECRLAMAGGAAVDAPFFFAEVLLLQGKLDEALSKLEVSIAEAIERRMDTSAARNMRGYVLFQLGRTEEAGVAAAETLKASPGYEAAQLLQSWISMKKKSTPKEIMGVLDGYKRVRTTGRLGRCAHLYLDLGMSANAERCFSISDRLIPGPADAIRALHQAETSPKDALNAALAKVKKVNHPDLMVAISRIHAMLEETPESLRWAEEAVKKDPFHREGQAQFKLACAKAKDPRCPISPGSPP